MSVPIHHDPVQPIQDPWMVSVQMYLGKQFDSMELKVAEHWKAQGYGPWGAHIQYLKCAGLVR